MPEPVSISSGIAERYATAVFEIARANNNLGKLESSVDDLAETMAASEDLRDMIASPVLTRDAQGAAIAAVAKAVGVPPVLEKVLGLMAEKRRLFVVPQLLTHLTDMIAKHKGEVTSEVTSAQALSPAQSRKLAETLKARVGQDVKIKATVDESLIGGLVIKIGSKMIDTSMRARLNALQNAMKEVG